MMLHTFLLLHILFLVIEANFLSLAIWFLGAFPYSSYDGARLCYDR